jgi:hypothetical protein
MFLVFTLTKKPQISLRLFIELRLLAVETGFEPATPCVTGTYSNQLNYPTDSHRYSKFKFLYFNLYIQTSFEVFKPVSARPR